MHLALLRNFPSPFPVFFFLSPPLSNGYGKQVPVDFDIHSNVNDYVITDEEWLWQMLLNLLTNACKYTARGSIRVVVSLKAPAVSPAAVKAPAKVMIGKVGLPLLKLGEPAPGPTQLLFEVIDTGKIHTCPHYFVDVTS